MRWQHRFTVAGFTVAIESNCPDTTPIIRDLTALYEPAATDAHATFTILREANQITLRLNNRILWRGSDAGEIAAGFEVHLYRQLITAVSPLQCSIHAASLMIGNGVSLFAGESGAGKSSIATKAVLEGCPYLSDEFALLGEDGRITPFPRPLQWGKQRHPAFTHQQMLASGRVKKSGFSFTAHGGGTIHALHWLPHTVIHQPQPLRHIVLHQFDKAATTPEITPIRRSEALMTLQNHLHHRQQPDLMLKTLNRRIGADVSFFRFRYGDIHRAWPLLIKKLENSKETP